MEKGYHVAQVCRGCIELNTMIIDYDVEGVVAFYIEVSLAVTK